MIEIGMWYVIYAIIGVYVHFCTEQRLLHFKLVNFLHFFNIFIPNLIIQNLEVTK